MSSLNLPIKNAKLEEIIQNLGENFDIAPSSIVLSTLEQELSREIGRESRLCDTLKNFKNNYDYILIDCPPNLGILTINATPGSERNNYPGRSQQVFFRRSRASSPALLI